MGIHKVSRYISDPLRPPENEACAIYAHSAMDLNRAKSEQGPIPVWLKSETSRLGQLEWWTMFTEKMMSCPRRKKIVREKSSGQELPMSPQTQVEQELQLKFGSLKPNKNLSWRKLNFESIPTLIGQLYMHPTHGESNVTIAGILVSKNVTFIGKKSRRKEIAKIEAFQ